MGKWLRRRLITGFFVTVPLAVSVIVLVWMFQGVDSMTSGLSERIIGRYVPGLGILATLLIVLAIGTLSTNVFGKRLLRQAEDLLLHLPIFRTIYAPLKQISAAFSPDNELGFKRVVLVEDAGRGSTLGFLTREFVVDRGSGPETLLAVFVPTNHLYLGDLLICPPDRVFYPDLTVEQGIRVFLTGGMALPMEFRAATHPTHGAQIVR
jgi:uncharacterized membrane protein